MCIVIYFDANHAILPLLCDLPAGPVSPGLGAIVIKRRFELGDFAEECAQCSDGANARSAGPSPNKPSRVVVSQRKEVAVLKSPGQSVQREQGRTASALADSG